MIRVTVWNEYEHERTIPAIGKVEQFSGVDALSQEDTGSSFIFSPGMRKTGFMTNRASVKY